jgi:Sulfatase
VPATSAVIVVIDRLGAGWLGPYGDTWLDTSSFNALAARSVLCETVIADTADLAGGYRAFWSGQHAMEPQTKGRTALAELAAAAGAASVLVSDDREVIEHPLASQFADQRLLPEVSAAKSAETIEQTGLFSLFDAARKVLQKQTRPFLLWVHARGMSGPWDAPLELRFQFADEEDPEPPRLVKPPNVLLPEDVDPDELLGFVHAYAGQVALADMCLGMLLNAIEEHPLKDETLLVVTSPRGYPLGEHRRVGPCDDALYGELLHVPLLLQFPDQAHALTRCGQIVQPRELYSLVAETCRWQPTGESRSDNQSSALLRELHGDSADARNVACAVGRDQRAIRTRAWYLLERIMGDGPQRELFAKPDDRWESNEVSSRCGDVVELLASEVDRFQQAAGEGRLSESPPLAELLCDIWR